MNKISIIIPCYNGEKTIKKCLDSILLQTYTNLEIIVVDDGSTDNSLRILQEYAQLDSRITVLSKPNGGVSSARNAGLRLASGDFIQFCDIDDKMRPNMLMRLIESLQGSNADIAVCRFTHCCFKPFLSGGVYDMRDKSDFRQFFMDFFTFNVPWNKLYRRHLINANFDESIKIFEDGLFVLSTILNAGRVAVIEDELYDYYTAPGTDSAVSSILKSKFWRNKQGHWYKYDMIKPLFEKLLTQSGHTDDMIIFARSFDIAFWEFIKLIDSGFDKRICALEMHGIFNQPNFVQSIKARGFAYSGVDFKTVLGFVSRSIDLVLSCKQSQASLSNGENPQVNVGVLYWDIIQLFYKECLSPATGTQCEGCEDEALYRFLQTKNAPVRN